MNKHLKILKDFAEGVITITDFEKLLYAEIGFETVLSDKNIDTSNLYLGEYDNIYTYLISLNYKNAEDWTDIHHTVCSFLEVKQVGFSKTLIYEDFLDVMLSAQPKYLDILPSFYEQYIWKLNYETLSKIKQKQKVKETINALFKYHKKPPKWIQNPNWPIENNKPLFFLGQYEIKDCNVFHDNGCVYLFVNDKKEIKTIAQFY